jgi:hypothetical protein
MLVYCVAMQQKNEKKKIRITVRQKKQVKTTVVNRRDEVEVLRGSGAK